MLRVYAGMGGFICSLNRRRVKGSVFCSFPVWQEQGEKELNQASYTFLQGHELSSAVLKAAENIRKFCPGTRDPSCVCDPGYRGPVSTGLRPRLEISCHRNVLSLQPEIMVV